MGYISLMIKFSCENRVLKNKYLYRGKFISLIYNRSQSSTGLIFLQNLVLSLSPYVILDVDLFLMIKAGC